MPVRKSTEPNHAIRLLFRPQSLLMAKHTDIVAEGPADGVLVVRLNRPDARNALRTAMLAEIAQALQGAERDEAVRCVVITGSERVFAAGADLREMSELDAVAVWRDERIRHWKVVREFSKPLIAAVNGFCLGGGCELAMHADIIIAGANARFGQPEINLGIIPGAGGTQRLARTVGKSLTMKMVLSGEPINAAEALGSGLAAEVTQPEVTLRRALELARTIAAKAPLAAQLAKQSVLGAFETTLSQGLELERRAFVLLAATEDRAEGIDAFLAKRPPEFKGR